MKLIHGDCLEKLKDLPDNSVDSIVTDPPYGIGFMNKEWDSPEKLRQQQERDLERTKVRNENGTAPVTAKFSPFPGQGFKGRKEGLWFQQWCEEWGKECLRVLKPGGHLLSFSAPRMYHRMTTGLEDAGFEIRDQIMWVFGSGFPKSYNIGKGVEGKMMTGNSNTTNFKNLSGDITETSGGYNKASLESGYRDKEYTKTKIDVDYESEEGKKWNGWGTALKPAHEPIVVARKPISEKSVIDNVLEWGTGGINIDESRVVYKDDKPHSVSTEREGGNSWNKDYQRTEDWEPNNTGRFPANIILDEEAGQVLDEQSGISGTGKKKIGKERQNFFHNENTIFEVKNNSFTNQRIEDYGDKGGASRFFYCPKASKKDREDMNNHPTVKPTELMLYLIKLVTPKGGTVLEPFMGSGSTGKAAIRGGYDFIGIEKEEEYLKIAQARIENEYGSKH